MRINGWLLAAMTCTAALAGDDVPSWFREFASTKTPSYSAKVSAVVILRERRITVDEGGRATTIERAVQQEVQRVEVRQLEALDFAGDHALKMPCHACRCHLLDEQRVILGLERNQADVGRVAFITRSSMG